MRYHRKALFVWSIVLVLVWGALRGQAGAWTKIAQPFPNGRATFILHTFCLSEWCPLSPAEWRTLIEEAVAKWERAGSGFEFIVREARATDDPCRLNPGEVAVIWTNGTRKCREDYSALAPAYGGLKGEAVALLGQRAARVYLYSKREAADAFEIKLLAPFVLLHELGHVLGLGHPNEVGQTVTAIMNTGGGVPVSSNFYLHPQLQPDDIAGVQALYGVRPTSPPLTGFLENPAPGSSASGIGIISGWVCDAESVMIHVLPHNSHDFVAYGRAFLGTERRDTREACGDTDNGFGLLFNWNLLGDGQYRIVVFADGDEFDSATVTVTTLGEEFVRGTAGAYVLEDFPGPGQSVVVEWEESLQNFVIVGRNP